jgi:hypothetical protein
LALLFLLLILFQGGGLQCFYLFKQKLAQVEMVEKLVNNKAEVQHISIPSQDYHKKLINGQEIELNGKLYDIRKVILSEKKAYLSVVEDAKEMHVISMIKKIMGSERDDRQQFPQKLLSFMSMLFIQSNFTYYYYFPNPSVAQYSDFVQLLPLGNIETPFSPPDCI